jgi:hypothetical protein
MKITPLGAGTGAGSIIGNLGDTVISQERKDAAKKAYLGQTSQQTQITRSDTPIDERIQHAQQNIRSIKMNTNATPGRYVDDANSQEQTVNTTSNDTSAQNSISETVQNGKVVVNKPLSDQAIALAKHRRSLQVKESELVAREKALAEGNTNSISLEALKSNPLKVMRDAGVTYDQLTESILADSNGTQEIQELRNEIKSLKEGIDKNLSDRDQAAEQQVLKEIQREIDSLVASGTDFELIKVNGSQKEVTKLIQRTWKEQGIVLDTREAAKMVEDMLEEDAIKFAGLDKIRSKLTPQQQGQMQTQQSGMRSLSNRDAARPILGRKERAMAAALGQLKR